MAESKWMVHRAGKWAGPYGEAQLREYVAKGIMDGNVLVRNEAGQVMPIHDAFGPQTTPQFLPAPQPPPKSAHPQSNDLRHLTSYDTVPRYGALSIIAQIYTVLGAVALCPSVLMAVGGIIFGEIVVASIGGGLVGSAIACLGFAEVFRVLIDLGRNSHKQTLLLERMSSISLATIGRAE